MPKDAHLEITPANLVMAQIASLGVAIQKAPKSRQLAVARAARDKAKQQLSEAETAFRANPSTLSFARARDKAQLAFDDAKLRVRAAQEATTPQLLAHLSGHVPDLQRTIADVSGMLAALAAVMQDATALAVDQTGRRPDVFRDASGIVAASAYIKARFPQ